GAHERPALATGQTGDDGRDDGPDVRGTVTAGADLVHGVDGRGVRSHDQGGTRPPRAGAAGGGGARPARPRAARARPAWRGGVEVALARQPRLVAVPSGDADRDGGGRRLPDGDALPRPSSDLAADRPGRTTGAS